MKKSGEGRGRFTESHRGTRYQQCIYDKNLFLTRGANDPPPWVGLDLPGADGSGENEIGIASRDILQPDRPGRPVNVGVNVLRARDVNQLAHEAARPDRYQRRIPDMPEHPRLRIVSRREPDAVEGVLDGVNDGSCTCGIVQQDAE